MLGRCMPSQVDGQQMTAERGNDVHRNYMHNTSRLILHFENDAIDDLLQPCYKTLVQEQKGQF